MMQTPQLLLHQTRLHILKPNHILLLIKRNFIPDLHNITKLPRRRLLLLLILTSKHLISKKQASLKPIPQNRKQPLTRRQVNNILPLLLLKITIQPIKLLY